MKEIYGKEITDPSLLELEELALWYNEKIGNYPAIVGGWAVYFYTTGLGSKDIDVVFAGDKAKHQTLFAYFQSHGFKERQRSLFDREFYKEIVSGKRKVEIIVDAVSQNRIILFEGRKARIPWAWAMKHSKEHKIGKATILIPEIDILLIYKLGAALGRSDILKTGLDFDYYRSKVWKDVYDVLSLAEIELDANVVRKFLKESGLDDYKEEILQIIEDNFDDEMKGLLKNATLGKIRMVLTGDG